MPDNEIIDSPNMPNSESDLDTPNSENIDSPDMLACEPGPDTPDSESVDSPNMPDSEPDPDSASESAPETHVEIRKTAMVTICGRPNVGKSTLTNALVGEKVAIVSNKAQTTRNRITGIFTHGDTQLVLLDTPGFHKPRNRLGDYMVKVVNDSIPDVELVVLVVEPIAHIGPQEEGLMERIRQSQCPAVLAINKIDTVEKPALLEVIALYAQACDFDAVIPISARTRDGLDDLLAEMCRHAVEGPPLFPEDMYTDQPERQLCAEIIREKLLLCLDKEIPHGTAVEITRFLERPDGVVEIDATIYCEKASHKGIIIGKKGAMLQKTGSLARRDLEKLLGTHVYLQTWVKVREGWRNSNAQLRNFGYRRDT